MRGGATPSTFPSLPAPPSPLPPHVDVPRAAPLWLKQMMMVVVVVVIIVVMTVLAAVGALGVTLTLQELRCHDRRLRHHPSPLPL